MRGRGLLRTVPAVEKFMFEGVFVSAVPRASLPGRLALLGRVLGFGIVLAVGILSCVPSPATVSVEATNTAAVPNTAVPPTAASAAVVLTHGPIVGAVTDSFAKVFARTSDAAGVSIRYGVAADLSDAVTTAAQETGAADDFTTQVPLTNLKPSTVYYLDVLVNGDSAKSAPFPSFKTFPPQGTAQNFSFVSLTDFKIATAQDFYPAQTFMHVSADHPDLVLLGGDFDHTGPLTLDQKRDMFKALYSPHNAYVDFVTQILQKFPLAHYWDDHDFGPNNADRTYPDAALSRQVLQEYFPTYPLGEFGDWQSFSYAQADFFLLDSRSQRDTDKTPDGPNKSMLDGTHHGANGQLAWLLDHLKQSKATWKFIMTPVVFNPTHPKADAWNGFQYEHDLIVKFIHDNNIHGVIMLSGDSHFGAIDNGTNSGLPEMEVPPANIGGCLTARGTGTWSEGVFAPQKCPGYGFVQVTTNPDRVTLQVKNDTGVVQLHYTTAP